MAHSFLQCCLLCCMALQCLSSTLKFESKANGKFKQLKEVRDTELLFQNWTGKHGKKYDNVGEYFHRLTVFRENVKLIKQVNAENRGYKLGLNIFADLTFAEFKQRYLINTPQHCSATRKGNHVVSSNPLPVAVDWRKKGIVSPVKNQGACGSCWTFSTTGAMEAHIAMKYGVMYSLSEQQLIDCAQAFDNHGCSGGLPSQAFEYIHYNDGLMLERDYSYKAKDGKCHFDHQMAVAFVKEIVNITSLDENMLADAVANAGPVSIAFQVAKDFHLYKSGVYSSEICKSDPLHVNHAVLAVGYNVTETGKKYWIVKNSWGTTFGMDGYFYIERGKNMCGLADCASYPVVTNS